VRCVSFCSVEDLLQHVPQAFAERRFSPKGANPDAPGLRTERRKIPYTPGCFTVLRVSPYTFKWRGCISFRAWMTRNR
jgi:hypothetical protein